MSFFARGPDEEEESFTESHTSAHYDRHRFQETTTDDDSGYRPPPPQVPYPWRAQWEDGERRYIFINEQNGERTWEFPAGYVQQQQSDGGSYGGGESGQRPQYQRQEYGGQEQKHGHGMMYGALGAAAGLAGGAFLAHEWNQNGDQIEDKFEHDKNDVENFPENAARWTGEKVGDVEDIPQDVEQGFDRFGDRVEQGWDHTVANVEDAPGDVAEWVGGKVGGVERFGDEMDGAYDEGRYEGRDGF